MSRTYYTGVSSRSCSPGIGLQSVSCFWGRLRPCLFHLDTNNFLLQSVCTFAQFSLRLKFCLYTIVHCESKKTNDIFRSQLFQVFADFQNFLTLGFRKKFTTKHLSCFPPHVNCVATLPCETWNATYIILPPQLLQKLTSKFVQFFLLNVIHIIWHVLP